MKCVYKIQTLENLEIYYLYLEITFALLPFFSMENMIYKRGK